jgi:DNA topoisomerase-1
LSKEQKTENTGAERGKLFPTDIGAVVNDFLVQYFKEIVDFNFTASVEKQFDEIAQGMKEWTAMLHDFYNPFHKGVQSTIETADKATGERELVCTRKAAKRFLYVLAATAHLYRLAKVLPMKTKKSRLYASLRATGKA